MLSRLTDWIWFYHGQKFNIIPLKEKDKKPNIPSWQEWQKKEQTKEQIQEWIDKEIFQNIGIICGHVSNDLVVIDLDDKKIIDDLELKIEKIIENGHWVVKTGRGYHIYCRNNSNPGNIIKEDNLHIEYRGNGGYVVAPPSIHPNGTTYEFFFTTTPNDLKKLIQKDVKIVFQDMVSRLSEKKGLKKSKDRIIDLKKGVQYGSRNTSAFRVACSYRNKGLSREETTKLMMDWNKKNKPSLPDNEIINCIKSSYSKDDLKYLITEQIFKEPVFNSQELKWLYISNHNESNSPIFETHDPDLWQCKKCKLNIQSGKKPFFCSQCNRESNFERLTEHINSELWKIPIWKDTPVEDLDMQNTFIDILQIIKQCLILPEEIQYKLLTLWIIASWKTECWDAVPFLIFRGLIESGKTRGLDIIRELGCRMMHTSGVTFPAMVRATHFYNAGVLLDEIDNKVDKRTELGRAMIDFLKPSYRKGSVYTVADREDQTKIITYKNFGFKAFAGEKGGYDDAIFSRAIDFQMEQDYPEITELKSIQFDLNNIQTILLNYKYKTSEPEELPEEIKLKGRDREIYSCIIRTAMHIGIEYNDILDFIKQTQNEKQDETESSDEYQILKIIREFEHQPTLDDSPETICYADIAEELGWEEQKRQKLGYIFKKKLILKTKRMNKGSVVLLNDPKNIRKLKSLYRRFKL